MRSEKKIVIIAGPNGAGKTTFALEYLPKEAGCPIFVNADLIAGGLSPFQPEAAAIRAGRLMIEAIAAHARRGESFAFETTLSGLRYVRLIPQWRTLGYHVKLVYLSLPNPEIAIARVAARVVQGGHNVSEAVIRRRFVAGRRNFRERYMFLANAWVHYDNASEQPILINEGVNP
ncbi:MAG: zeta toxin family protein [Nitrospirae bacterium]|nr:zeta toxin family protein [Nitrospirota bacterium]